jgi:hypothetical protein
MKRRGQISVAHLGAEERQRMCTRKRRYRSQGDALDAAMIAGAERRRKAYLCPLCGRWHLTTA